MGHRTPRRTAPTLATSLAAALAVAALLTSCADGPAEGADTTATTDTAVGAPTSAGLGSLGSTPAPTPEPPPSPTQGATTVQIQLTAGDVVLTATLADNPTAQAFAAALPITVPISDHASTEKTFYPPAELTTEGAADGYDPSLGDLAYYSPWGNVAVYYRDFSWSAGLVPLGRLDGDATALADLPDGTELRVELL